MNHWAGTLFFAGGFFAGFGLGIFAVLLSRRR